MEVLAAVEASALASHLRVSRWTYPFVNAAHVVGVAMVFGAILPLDLRLVGFRSRLALDAVAAAARPVAAAGFVLAVLTGALLFSVSARAYAATPLFGAKMALVVLGFANALAFSGDRLLRLSAAGRRAVGAASIGFWLAAIFAGRWLGYLE